LYFLSHGGTLVHPYDRDCKSSKKKKKDKRKEKRKGIGKNDLQYMNGKKEMKYFQLLALLVILDKGARPSPLETP
jgi:hypothetical protein